MPLMFYCSQCQRSLSGTERGVCHRKECLDAARVQVFRTSTDALMLVTREFGNTAAPYMPACGQDWSTKGGVHLVPKPVEQKLEPQPEEKPPEPVPVPGGEKCWGVWLPHYMGGRWGSGSSRYNLLAPVIRADAEAALAAYLASDRHSEPRVAFRDPEDTSAPPKEVAA